MKPTLPLVLVVLNAYTMFRHNSSLKIFDWLTGTIARKQIFPLLKVYFGPVMSRRPPREPKMKVILYGAQAILDSLLRVS